MPDDPDKMFVVDISTEVIEENGKPTAVFRIFISTTRLLTFTEYVSEKNCAIDKPKLFKI